jgi:hypothetical protein
MSGTQLAKITREQWPDMSILLATGYSDLVPGEDINLSRLTKPYLQSDLAAAIARLDHLAGMVTGLSPYTIDQVPPPSVSIKAHGIGIARPK